MNRIFPVNGNRDVSIVLCGQAGQGIATVEYLLTRIFKLCGFNVFATKEYMSRIRGGSNSTQIRISDKKVRCFVSRTDILVPLDNGAIEHVKNRTDDNTVILSEKDNLSGNEKNVIEIPFTQIATEIGNKLYSNIVSIGAITALFEVPLEFVKDYIIKYFVNKPADVIEKNIEAVSKGYRNGAELVNSGRIKINITADAGVKENLLLSGGEAVSLGAMAGGCNFVSSYPMSPSTAVLTFMAQQAKDFGFVVEQAEDEIAAVNMAIGAWCAGARAMATTSGGGFALMTEGLSLAGMFESPLVIHLGQRPGPATGLPTRTEQGDLELALYAGHGEFPRIILAPGTIEDAFELSQRAFNLADKCQVPVFILTDEYFIDSYYNVPSLDISKLNVEKYFVKTSVGYKRFKLTDNGLSPRGIPGFGEGLVLLDSDEHDEDGHITEDLDLRTKMVDKRLAKFKLVEKEIIAPKIVGPKDYNNLVVCWGSTYNVVEEALMKLDRKDTAFVHYTQVYPLSSSTAELLKKAQKRIIVENNATSQFGKLIKLNTGIEIENRILKYNGMCFSVEELSEKLDQILD